jgi:PTS system ascorbate-specific IIA component
MMKNIDTKVTLDAIQVHQHASTWEEAIQIAADPLVSKKSIKPLYIDAMIDSVKKLGPYIVLMPGFALAHAAPSSQVIRSDISVAVFDDPIVFHSNNDPVYVVMCLACTDHVSHVKRLQSIAQLFLDDEELVSKIRTCGIKQELQLLLSK